MARVQIRDTSLWTKHIRGDGDLQKKLEALEPGEKIWLRIAGRRGCFEKMKPGPNGPMPGLKPLDRQLWRELYPARKGELVDLALDDGPANTDETIPSNWESASDAERDAAWEAFKALAKAGWRSEAAGGGRDELHDR